jgi:hypothetical protein
MATKAILQIDVIDFTTAEKVNYVACRLYTDKRMIRIVMTETAYNALVNDGFFIRDGDTKDSAGVWNTTRVFEERLHELTPTEGAICEGHILE